MMARKGKQVYGYVDPSVKERIRRICEKDERCSESWVVKQCLSYSLSVVEKELGISEPAQKASTKRRS